MVTRIISDGDRKLVEEKLAQEMEGDVRLVFFTRKSKVLVPGQECLYCEATEQLLTEIADLSGKIRLETHDPQKEPEIAAAYGIDKVPAVALVGARDYGIRFYGIPSGYEFGSLLEAIIDVSRGRTKLKQETREALATLEKDVEIQVFVTPTCPYCPRAARVAQQMAIESDRVRGIVIEANEFPDLSQKYGVYGVPKVVINEETEFEGAMPEGAFLNYVLEAAGAGSMEALN